MTLEVLILSEDGLMSEQCLLTQEGRDQLGKELVDLTCHHNMHPPLNPTLHFSLCDSVTPLKSQSMSIHLFFMPSTTPEHDSDWDQIRVGICASGRVVTCGFAATYSSLSPPITTLQF